jgi:hypothetical protein
MYPEPNEEQRESVAAYATCISSPQFNNGFARYEPARLVRLMREAIQRCELDLKEAWY